MTTLSLNPSVPSVASATRQEEPLSDTATRQAELISTDVVERMSDYVSSDAAEYMRRVLFMSGNLSGSAHPACSALNLNENAAHTNLDLVEAMTGGPGSRGLPPGHRSLASLVRMDGPEGRQVGLSLAAPDPLEPYDAAKAGGESILNQGHIGTHANLGGGGGATPAALSEGSWWDKLVSGVKAVAGALLPGPAGAIAGVGLDSNQDTYGGVEGLRRQGKGDSINKGEAEQLRDLERSGYRHELEPKMDEDLIEAYFAHLKDTPFDPNAGRRRIEERDETQPDQEVTRPNPLGDAAVQGSTQALSLAAQLTGPHAPEELSRNQLEREARARIGEEDRRSDPRVIDPNPLV